MNILGLRGLLRDLLINAKKPLVTASMVIALIQMLTGGCASILSAALCYGGWNMTDLLARWQQAVVQEGRFVPACYEGVRPVACDLTAF